MSIRTSKIKKASLLLATGLSSLTLICAATMITVVQFTFDFQSFGIAVAADNHNNAVAVLEDADVILATQSTLGTEWTPLIQISNSIGTKSGPDVAMDATGTALAIWIGNNSGARTIETKFFSNGIWTDTIPPVLETSPSFSQPSIAMNGLGKGLAAWRDDTSQMNASFFSNGVWSPFQVIGPEAGSGVDTAYSPSGKAAVAWSRFDMGINDIWANTFNGVAWQTATKLDTTGNQSPSVGIDAVGNAIAVWAGGLTTTVFTSRFNGTSWSANQQLSVGPNNNGQDVAVRLNGTAIAVWSDSTFDLQIAVFNGSVWSLPIPLLVQGRSPRITLDSQGNALLAWVSPSEQVFTGLLLNGSTTLEDVTFLRQASNEVRNLDVALSSGSTTGFTVWSEGVEGVNSFGTVILFGPFPPSDLTARECINRFATQSDRVNIIRWSPSHDLSTVRYEVRRNGILIATIPADGPFEFTDHNRCNKVSYIYTVTAFDALGIGSIPIAVTIVD